MSQADVELRQMPDVHFTGTTFTASSNMPEDGRVQAINKMSQHKNVKELQSFLVNFFNRYPSHLAELTDS